MSHPKQDPESLSTGRIARVALVAAIIGALGVGVAALLTPEALLAPTPRDDPREPIAGVDRGPIDGHPRGLDRHREARAALEGWGWADRDAGVATIPIEEAMELVARGVRAPGAPEVER